MNEKPEEKSAPGQTELSHRVGERAARKLKAQRHVTKTVWSGLGMMGIVGWSVAVPTLLGAALGLWLDRRFPGSRSWTLALLVAGLAIGCLLAWHWVAAEGRDIREQEENNHE
jgi:ATP synthase protein I